MTSDAATGRDFCSGFDAVSRPADGQRLTSWFRSLADRPSRDFRDGFRSREAPHRQRAQAERAPHLPSISGFDGRRQQFQRRI